MNLDFNIETKKLALIQWLTSLNDVSMIDKILELKQKETKDWWNEISDEEKESIEKGLSDAESGNLKPHSEIRKKYEKWLFTFRIRKRERGRTCYFKRNFRRF